MQARSLTLHGVFSAPKMICLTKILININMLNIMSAQPYKVIQSAGPDETIDDYDRVVNQILQRTLEVDNIKSPLVPSALLPIGAMICQKYQAILSGIEPRELLTRSLEEQAKYSDLTARFTAQKAVFSQEQLLMLDKDEIKSNLINTGSVGNCAYLCLHAVGSAYGSAEMIRAQWMKALDRLRILLGPSRAP
jgi:hypothetical protein